MWNDLFETKISEWNKEAKCQCNKKSVIARAFRIKNKRVKPEANFVVGVF